MKKEVEKLVAGETVTKEIRQELTYREMYSTVENIWSVLFAAGYLTQRGLPEGKDFQLADGNAKELETYFQEYLKKSISIRDTFVKKHLKENFYHGILIGILGYLDGWGISSNRETGDGYSDIVLESDDGEAGIIIEVKYAHDGNPYL